MTRGPSISILILAAFLLLALFAGCSEDNNPVGPSAYTPLIASMVLTPELDAGSPVPLELSGDRMAILYSGILNGTGDIYRLLLNDLDNDGVFDSFDVTEEYTNENDSSEYYLRPDHDQFTFIGQYEIITDGTQGDTVITNYPGNVYMSGPRHLSYEPRSDRIYYSLGYLTVGQIASTVSPRDAMLGHTGEIINDFDKPLEDIYDGDGRAPIWEFWHSKVVIPDGFALSGGNYASASPVMAGEQWLAYADTLLESYDRDGIDRGQISKAGEDPDGEIEAVIDGLPADGAPGYVGVDDDNDGEADLEDFEIRAITAAGVIDQIPAFLPPFGSVDWLLDYYSWNCQYYDPARDDDEDGLMDEDWSEQIDDDGDGLFGEDPPEGIINNDGDDETDEDPIDGIDNDGDGLIDEDPSEQIDNDGDGEINEDAPELAIDNDNDGQTDEDWEGDMNNDGAPGVIGVSDDGDELADLADPHVKHSLLRFERQDDYQPALDDDEDGLSDEDGDIYRNGLWVVRLGEGGLPDPLAVPISLTNQGERQPFFHPMGTDPSIYLLCVRAGDIYRLTLEFSADDVNVTATENLTSSASLEAYPSYAAMGDDRIVFSSSQQGSADIWILEPDGSQKQVTNAPGQELYPRFTPNGLQVLYEAWRFPEGDRRVMVTTGELP